MADRDGNGKFIKGHTVKSPGRPRGYRQQFVEQFVQTLQEDFEKHGAAAMVQVRQEKPEVYLQVAAKLIPKEIEVDMYADILNEITIRVVE
tara:strand:- start:8053 stop:8325 length:273 start_codon:yes stop_codon:yes gene_type:complete